MPEKQQFADRIPPLTNWPNLKKYANRLFNASTKSETPLTTAPRTKSDEILVTKRGKNMDKPLAGVKIISLIEGENKSRLLSVLLEPEESELASKLIAAKYIPVVGTNQYTKRVVVTGDVLEEIATLFAITEKEHN